PRSACFPAAVSMTYRSMARFRICKSEGPHQCVARACGHVGRASETPLQTRYNARAAAAPRRPGVCRRLGNNLRGRPVDITDKVDRTDHIEIDLQDDASAAGHPICTDRPWRDQCE